ncbi:hypothetical protein BV898_09090 [Hypsibius exemplaris]|uniref:Uncharacterized protein n=1 Tax=Hypsibius exemplaris TaxID=2072580 RepID=A0A1W0WNI0_HYPEX|nr:hypothetical protein BV898_09090 [Hypsibius exemplaris]
MSFNDLDANFTVVPLYTRDQIDSAYYVQWLHLPRHILNANEKYIGNLSDSARAEYETPFRQFDGIQR